MQKRSTLDIHPEQKTPYIFYSNAEDKINTSLFYMNSYLFM